MIHQRLDTFLRRKRCTLLGVGRFSPNALVRGLCYAYVELFRNVPILLQLLVWYLVLTELLPDSSEPISIGSVYLSKGGLSFPAPEWVAGHGWMALGALAGNASALGFGFALPAVALVVALPLLRAHRRSARAPLPDPSGNR